MLAEERREWILDRIYRFGRVHTSELSEQLGVSVVTVRGDLAALEERGRVVRTRGGAVSSIVDTRRADFDARLSHRKAEKNRIAVAASALLADDECVILDAGTTVMSLAHHMPTVSNLTVMTPGINIAQRLMNLAGVDVHVMGGRLNADTVGTIDPPSNSQDVSVIAHKVFLGAHTVDDDLDITETTIDRGKDKQRLIRSARQVILLADSSKWGHTAQVKVANVASVDVVVTNEETPTELITKMENLGTRVVTA